MKKVIVLLSMLFVVLISSQGFAYTEPATVDMNGEVPPSSNNICDQSRPIFDPGKAMFWDSICGGNNSSEPETDVYIPEIVTPDPEDFDWDKWQKEFDKDWDNPGDHKAENAKRMREKKQWAIDFSHWLIHSMPQYFNYHPDIAADLYQLRRDLYNPILRAKIESCMAFIIFNDAENVGNQISHNDTDALIGRQVMGINNCYRQLK